VLGGLVLGCERGHRFDANRRGFLSAIDAGGGIAGDTREILEARARFLDLGHYRPIMDAVAASMPPSPSLRVLDAGSGTGHYLAHVLSAGSDRTGLALDASSPAVALSVARADSPGLVADTWKPLPVRSGRADVILCVFAPRNPAEFARILAPNGALVVVTPAQAHLQELRGAGLTIGMQQDKLEALGTALGPHFSLDHTERVSFTMMLDAHSGGTLAFMGPSGHHERAGAWQGGDVTAEVDVTVWRR
jgi:23S rRNA (guanine745-N1)-methyltransferase